MAITVTGHSASPKPGPSNGRQTIPLSIARPTFVGVLTQRYGPQRTGANLSEHVLTVASVSSPEFQKLYTISVVGQVSAQPLLAPQLKFPDRTLKNVLVIATMANYVYAFQVDDAVHGPAFPPQLLWSVTIGPAVSANFTPMGASTWTCSGAGAGSCYPNPDAPSTAAALPSVGNPPGHTTWFGYTSINGQGLYNINPSIGIVSTPVIDPISNKIFAVGKVDFGLGPENDLVAIDMTKGVIVNRTKIAGQVIGSAPDSQNGIITFDQVHHMQRPALLLQNGQIYIGFGSHQDTPPWHGWIFRYDANTLQQSGVWCSTPNSALGGAIWQAGSGIAADSAGNIYVMTGNGCNLDADGHCADAEYPAELNSPPDYSFSTGMSNFANMFVQLSPELTAPVPAVPGDEQHREAEDLDLGSAGPVFVPGTNSLVGGDKEGRFFVLSTTPRLTLTQTLQVAMTADTNPPSIHGSGYHHIHGSPAFWRGPKGVMAYVWPERDYLRALHWSDSASQFDCQLDPNGCENGNTTVPDQQGTFPSPMCAGCMPGGIVSLSADGAASGTGIVWASLPLETNDPPLIGGGLNRVVPGVLHALNAEDIKQDIWNSEQNPARDGSFMFAKFTPPMVANGRVYMATFGDTLQTSTGTVNVYGMRQWAKFISQRYPENSVPVGTNFQASVTFLNGGITAWTPGEYFIQLASPISGMPTSFPLSGMVGPGSQVTFTLSLPAPSPDAYVYQWQMSQRNSGPFGDLTPLATVHVGGQLSVAVATQRRNTTVTVNDAATNAPLAGVNVLVDSDQGHDSYFTSGSGAVTFKTPTCYDTGVRHPVRVACDASASKPGYGTVDFSVHW